MIFAFPQYFWLQVFSFHREKNKKLRYAGVEEIPMVRNIFNWRIRNRTILFLNLPNTEMSHLTSLILQPVMIILLCRILENQSNCHYLLQEYGYLLNVQDDVPTDVHDYCCFLSARSSMEHKEKQTRALLLLGEPLPQREFVRMLTQGKRRGYFNSLTGSQRCSEQKRFSYVLLFLPFKTRALFSQIPVTFLSLL